MRNFLYPFDDLEGYIEIVLALSKKGFKHYCHKILDELIDCDDFDEKFIIWVLRELKKGKAIYIKRRKGSLEVDSAVEVVEE